MAAFNASAIDAAVPIDAALHKRIPWLAALSPALRARLETRGSDGMTPVLSGLSIPIAGNDVVWLAGQAPVAKPDGSAPLTSLVHWEVFSAAQLVAVWEPAAVRDETEDLTLDVPERAHELFIAARDALWLRIWQAKKVDVAILALDAAK